MAHNHRGQQIADPYLNTRNASIAHINTRNASIAEQELDAQRDIGIRGVNYHEVNYNPEKSEYDEAYGPANRTRFMSRSRGVASGMSGYSHFADEQTNVEDRRVRGEN